MTEVRFYHLRTKTPDRALPEILGKVLEQGRRAVVRTVDEKEAERLNEYLWTFDPESFLPHGTAKDGAAEDQPVWLTHTDENPNSADTLIVTGGASAGHVGDFRLCCEMLDGHDEAALKESRARWQSYREKGYNVTYWQQTDKGGWEQKKSG